MKTLLFLINILGISITSPIQRIEIPLRRGYDGNINAIYSGKGDLKNSSANENRNQESGNVDPQEGEIFLNLTKGYVIADEVPPVNALNLQEYIQALHNRETGSLSFHSGAGLMEGKGSSRRSTQESMDTYVPFQIGKVVLGHHTDLIPKIRNSEQNGSEHLRDNNAVHGPVSAAEVSVTQEKEIFSDKQHIGGFQATSGFIIKKGVDVLYSEHYYSLGNYHFRDEGMQGDDPGYANDFDSSQWDMDQRNSSQQQGEPDSPSSSNEGSKYSSIAKDYGNPKDSSRSTDANSPTDSKNSRDSSSSSDSSDSIASKDPSDSSSSSDVNDISRSSDFSDSISSRDSRNSSDSNDPSSSSDSNRSDSNSLSDSSDSSKSSEFRSSSESDNLSDSNNTSTSAAYSKSDW